MQYDLSVIVPTFSEKDNLRPLVNALERALRNISWEVIFVDDDSPDGTSALARQLAAENPRVRCIQRIGRRGLSSACIEGMLASSAPFLAVMDADLQHDETILPEMLDALRRERLDIVVGSRYVAKGSTGDLPSSRVRISKFASMLARTTMGSDLTDPMSGFFMLRREFLEQVVDRVSAKGFKILLDLFGSAQGKVAYREIPYRMRARTQGESKLDTMAALEYLMLLIDKLVGRVIPIRFILFCLVGLGGVVVHLAVLGISFRWLEIGFEASQAAAAFMAMTQNYLINNIFTYRDKRQHGTAALVGLVKFYLTCGVGALISVFLAGFLFGFGIPWWLAGILGAGVGAVWNYAVTAALIWMPPRARARQRSAVATD